VFLKGIGSEMVSEDSDRSVPPPLSAGHNLSTDVLIGRKKGGGI
jgi:hypothetical protein